MNNRNSIPQPIVGQFYKNEAGQWLTATKIHFPDGVVLSEDNKIEKDGWKWYETPPYTYTADGLEDVTLLADIAFGEKLLRTFLQDNRGSTATFTPELMAAQDTKFGEMEKYAKRGVISYVKMLLEATEVDVVFTQARKDKYVAMCVEYLASNISA